MSDKHLCEFNFHKLLQDVFPAIKHAKVSVKSEINFKSVQFQLAVFLAARVYNVKKRVIKKCFPAFFELEVDLTSSYDDLITLYNYQIHEEGVSDLASILKIILNQQYAMRKRIEINWTFVFNQLNDTFPYGYIISAFELTQENLSKAAFKPHEIKDFLQFSKKFFNGQNSLFPDEMRQVDFSSKFSKFNIDLNVCREIQSYFARHGLTRENETFSNIIYVLVLIDEARTWNSSSSLCIGGGNEGRKRKLAPISKSCIYRKNELKYLKSAGEMLLEDKQKNSFLIDPECVKNSTFVKYQDDKKGDIINFLFNMKTSTTLETVKKMSVKRIIENLNIINNVLTRPESQAYLSAIVNNGTEPSLPKRYALPDKKVKIEEPNDESQIDDIENINAGTGITNSGVSCFIIATLQMLFHSPSFVSLLMERNNTDQGSYECIIRELFIESQAERYNVMKQREPINIRVLEMKMMQDPQMHELRDPITGRLVQSSADEFLKCLLTSLPIQYTHLFSNSNWPQTGTGNAAILNAQMNFINSNGFSFSVNNWILNECRHEDQQNLPSSLIIICQRRLENGWEVDSSPIILPEQLSILNRKNYGLRSVVCTNSDGYEGHYVAFAKPLFSDTFYKFNDSRPLQHIGSFANAMNDNEFATQSFLFAYEELSNDDEINQTQNDSKTSEKRIHKSLYIKRKFSQKKIMYDLRSLNPKYKDNENLIRKEAVKRKRDNDDDFRTTENQDRLSKKQKKKTNEISDEQIEKRKQQKAEKIAAKQQVKMDTNEKILSFRENFTAMLKNGSKRDIAFSKVLETMREVPSGICICCYRAWFVPEMKKIEIEKLFEKFNKSCSKRDKISKIENFKKRVMREAVSENHFFCQTCHKTITSGKIPKFGPETGLWFTVIPPEISELNEIEERIISPVLPFMSVRELKPFSLNSFIGSKGATINLEIDVSDVVSTLPRKFNELSVQQIMLKRHLAHKSYYLYDIVRVQKVMNALKYLSKSKIYRELNLRIDEEIFKSYRPDMIGEKLNFISDPKILSEEEKEFNEKLRLAVEKEVKKIKSKWQEENETGICGQKELEIDFNIIYNEAEKEIRERQEIEEFLIELNKQQDLNDDEKEFLGREGKDEDFLVYQLPMNANVEELKKKLDFKNQDVNPSNDINVIAPGQKKKPIASRDIEYLDEKCFPRLYAGEPLKYERNLISYIKRIKHQLQSHDKRFCEPKSVLFLAKRKLEIQLQNAITIACRMSKDKTLTVKDILNGNRLDELCEKDECFRFLKNITITPSYLEHKKKIVSSMFRQCSFPVFFLTNAPSESYWPELIQKLYSDKHGKNISMIDALNLSHAEKTELIKNNPVLCVQYFHRRTTKMMDYLKKDDNRVFGENPVTDFIYRLESQMRGALHVHSLLYNEGFPRYKRGMPEKEKKKLLQRLEEIISTEYDLSLPWMNLQIHICTFSCKKYTNIPCRYNFPRYPMRETDILMPLEDPKSKSIEHETARDNLKKIKELLEEYRKVLKEDYNKRRKGEVVDDSFIKGFDSIDQMLKKLNISYDDYLLALRSELKQDTIYYRRKPNAIEVNNYNKDLLTLCESNIDIQYVLNPYSVANYLFSYVLKSDTGMIRLLREAVKESRDASAFQKESLRNIANKFNNSVVIGACQAAAYILGIPVTMFSRSSIFVNTGPKAKRIRMPKNNEQLRELNEDDTDIFSNGIIEHYSNRPKKFENLTLADFAAENNFSYQGNNMKIKPRLAKPRILRYVKYNKDKDLNSYHREMLMLFHPWRNEDKELDIEKPNKLKEVFDRNEKAIKMNWRKYNHKDISDSDLDACMTKPQNDNVDANNEKAYRRLVDDKVEEIDVFDVNNGVSKDSTSYSLKIPARVPNEKLREIMKNLNEGQRKFVNEVFMRCRNNKSALLLLQGTAGVGKSYTINAIYQLITNYVDKLTGDPGSKESCIVMLTATTGIASYLIQGTTFHTAFKFNRYNTNMSENMANSIRVYLRHMKVLIIDECSMMSQKHFHMLDERMKMVFGCDQPFGGKIMILVGDFMQAQVIRGKAIYHRLTDQPNGATIQNYMKDLLWEQFEVHTLTEVMRQKNSAYIDAVNSVSRGCLTNEQIRLIKTRECTEEKIPENAVRLFYTNSLVNSFNNKRIGNNFVNATAVDTAADNNLSLRDQQNVIEFFEDDEKTDIKIHKKLKLQIGIRYMVTVNLDISDCLVNGIIGILRYITYSKSNEPQILWLDFNDERVGSERKSKYKNIADNNQEIASNWVPFTREALEVNEKDDTKLYSKFRIIRNQFPLTICEAITMHKSQGQTFKAICLDFRVDTRIPTELLFVALSRTDYNGLYILGSFEKPNGTGNSKAINEIDRLLKSQPIKYSFDTLMDTHKGFVVIYQNLNSFSAKAQYIIADKWYSKSDVMIFSEANVASVHSYQIPDGFEVVFPLTEHNIKSTPNRGIVILAKIARNIKLHKLKIYESKSENIHMDFKSFIIDNHYVITGYRSPQSYNTTKFRQNLEKFINEGAPIPSNLEITFIGDFNFESGSSEKFKDMILNKLKLPKDHEKKELLNQLSKTDETTIRGTQIDIVYSSSTAGNAGIYPTYFSDHFPVFFRSVKNPNLPSTTSKSENTKSTNTQRNQLLPKTFDVGKVDIILPNRISEVEVIYNHQRAVTCDLINLCHVNSMFHGLFEMFKSQNYFQQYCDLDENSIFKFIIDILTVPNEQKNQAWANFLCEKFNIISFTDNHSRQIFNFDMNTFDLFEDRTANNFFGNFNSCVKVQKCPKCREVSQYENYKSIFLSALNSKNIHDLIGEIRKSLIQNVECNNINCEGITTNQLTFNKFVFITVEPENESDLILKEIPHEIVLPQRKKNELNKRIYQLQFIQNYTASNEMYENEDNFSRFGHYTAITNAPKSFIEIDDLKSHSRQYSHNFAINPHSMIYYDVTDQEISNSKIFDNCFSANILNLSGNSLMKSVHNMCCFNSFIHGLMRLYRLDKDFQEFTLKTHDIPIFSLINDISNAKSICDKNSTWLQYLYNLPNMQSKVENGDMAEADQIMLSELLLNHFSYHLECTNCNTVYELNGKKFGDKFLQVDMSRSKDIAELIYNFFDTFGQRKKCKDCQNSVTYVTEKLFFVHITNPHNYAVKDNTPEFSFSQIPQSLLLNEKLYKLAFVQNYENSWHFITKYNLQSNNVHLEIDDISGVKINNNNSLSNPKILVYKTLA